MLGERRPAAGRCPRGLIAAVKGRGKNGDDIIGSDDAADSIGCLTSRALQIMEIVMQAHADALSLTRSRFRERRLLPTVALIAPLAMTISAMAEGQARQFAQECALKEVAVVTLIEDHGAAGDLPADRLGKAGLTWLDARLACYEGRVGDALALYESIFDLGPVSSLRQKRP